ncbi:MAG: serine/threonine protein kinase [Myxococcaceae bacterium]|jgi:hypothetical protein|nr:serine/threonine protein kinase [Myxococcaceae bacterium]
MSPAAAHPELLAQVLALQQQVIDLRARLDREHQVSEGFRRFSERALEVAGSDDLWALAADEAVTAFSTENAVVLRVDGGALTAVAASCVSALTPEHLEALTPTVLDALERREVVLTGRPLPRFFGAETATLVVAAVRGQQAGARFAIVASVSTRKAPFYPSFDAGLGPLFAAFVNHAGALHQHLRSLTEAERANRELRRQVSERSAQLFAALGLSHAPESQSRVPVPGDVVDGRYRVEEKLGEGGMGSVFRVRRLDDGSRWALKVATSLGPRQLARLAREAHLLSCVRHRNVLQLSDIGVAAEGFMYLVLELIDGQDLRAWRDARAAVSLDEVLFILLEVARGLDKLHASHIAHRDLTPRNILLVREPSGLVVKVADFGVARHEWAEGPAALGLAEGGDTGSRATPTPTPVTATHLGPATPRLDVLSVTQTGIVVGTLQYLAPELLESPAASASQADVFSFGVVAWELVVGHRPFEGVTSARAFGAAACRGEPSTRPGSGFAGFDELVCACLAIDPGTRPTAAELVERLEALVRQRTTGAPG